VRGLHRDVLRLACELQPSQRVVDHLVVGLASKSNRTKIECCGGWAPPAPLLPRGASRS
jgi:hypothetical protein